MAVSRRVEVRVPGSVIDVTTRAAIPSERGLTATFALDATEAATREAAGKARGVPGPPSEDWVHDGFRAACTWSNRTVPPTLRIRAVSDIPLGIGLGAAVAASVAGVVGARALLALALDDAEVIRIVAAIDGSDDRVAASLAGHRCTIRPSCDHVVPTSA